MNKAQIQAALRAKLDARSTKKTRANDIVAACETETRDPNETEAAEIVTLRDEIRALDGEIDELAQRLDGIEDQERRDASADDLARRIGDATPGSPARVGREARTYTPDTDPRGARFLNDIAARAFNDFGAAQRLDRHMAEERVERGTDFEQRAVGTSAFGSLVVPQYLVDMVAPYARAGRPLANLCNHHDLPGSGMTVEISRITTGSTAAVQTQNSAASETNMDDTALSISVQTIAGQQTASVQSLERGSGIEQTILQDLISAYNAKLDDTLINQATSGLDAVTDANVDVAYTDASPTAAELWPKLFDVVQQVQTAALTQATADAFVMHPRRFWWLASNVGTSFPFVNLVGAGAQSGGRVDGTGYGAGASGYLAGLPVYLDANIVTNGGGGTNEDRIYCVSTGEAHLWEDPSAPVLIRAEQTNAASLGVLFVVYGFVAYTFSRYASAHGRIAGTGLATPSF